MALPRGGSKFFYAMGQSAAARGVSVQDTALLDQAPPHAVVAYQLGYRSNNGRS
jgi:hypothetical protein